MSLKITLNRNRGPNGIYILSLSKKRGKYGRPNQNATTFTIPNHTLSSREKCLWETWKNPVDGVDFGVIPTMGYSRKYIVHPGWRMYFPGESQKSSKFTLSGGNLGCPGISWCLYNPSPHTTFFLKSPINY